MNLQEVFATINKMKADGVIDRYAIGEAVGATFYLEPVSTLDVDVFVAFRPEPGDLVVRPAPIFEYLTKRGATVEGEYLVIAGWPVQFLPPTGPLVEEALADARQDVLEGEPLCVFTAEHLAAIALETGRAKDKARLLQFVEEGALDPDRFEAILTRHGLMDRWKLFEQQFPRDQS
jgi:hypothetical protein